jgi:hypothetical protein
VRMKGDARRPFKREFARATIEKSLLFNGAGRS